jgi:hypothetical protein
MMIISDAKIWSSIMLLELSITLLESIYSTGVTHDDYHMTIKMFLIVNTTSIIRYTQVSSSVACNKKI